MVDLHLGTGASVSTFSTPANVYTHSKVETITDTTSQGYFFSIEPNMPGEQIGDQVTVNMNLNLYFSMMGNASANVTGSNGMDHIAVTLNENPPVWPIDPDPANEIWTLPNITNVTQDGYQSYYHTFTAQLGDVIGVFLAADTYAEVTGAGDAYVNCSSSIYFTIELATNPMDFNRDGYVNLVDMAKFMKEWLWVRPGR